MLFFAVKIIPMFICVPHYVLIHAVLQKGRIICVGDLTAAAVLVDFFGKCRVCVLCCMLLVVHPNQCISLPSVLALRRIAAESFQFMESHVKCQMLRLPMAPVSRHHSCTRSRE